jgi:nicotinamidase-related amidase
MRGRAEAYIEEFNIEAKVDGWLRRIRETAVPRPHLQLRPSKCALIVIDMINYFAAPDGRCFLPAVSAILPRIQNILNAWRNLEGTIVFTRHGHTGAGDLGMMGRFYSSYININQPESEIIKELSPRPTEKIVRKTTYDAFNGTDLKDYLTGSGVSQVLITGVLAHLCGETTARSAFCHGFEVYFTADATATTTEQLHFGSLSALADGFAMVMSEKEIIEQCVQRKS